MENPQVNTFHRPANPTQNSLLTFPPEAMTGSLGDFARAMASGTEVPEEFYFAAGLTFFGAACGESLNLNATLKVEPRLYTVLLGESADVKKSTAFRNTAGFFENVWSALPAQYPAPSICYGVGSAEGLASSLKKNVAGVVLCYDELQALIAKSKIESSTLLPMVASLFEQTKYENTTKNHTLKVDSARLSIIGCCTTDTYSNMWTKDAIAIGFPNRLFVVWADKKRRVSWPEPRDSAKLGAIRDRFVQQLRKLPLTLDMTPEGKRAWQHWYDDLPSSIHTKRLDSIGFRLLGLIALTDDKDGIDCDVVKTVIRILDYEFAVRTLTDPIDADKSIARLEEAIRRQLRSRGPLSERELRRHTNADRQGLWMFSAALKNLITAQDIRQQKGGKYEQASSDLSSPLAISPISNETSELAQISSP
jgi:Protein of unknown function (DUF3987)